MFFDVDKSVKGVVAGSLHPAHFCRKENQNELKVHFEPQRMEVGFEDDVPFSIGWLFSFKMFKYQGCELMMKIDYSSGGAFPRPERLVQKIDDPSILKGFR